MKAAAKSEAAGTELQSIMRTQTKTPAPAHAKPCCSTVHAMEENGNIKLTYLILTLLPYITIITILKIQNQII